MNRFLVLVILTLVARPLAAATFTPGDVFSRGVDGAIRNITAGGNFNGQTPFAQLAPQDTGDIAFSADLSTMYVSSRSLGIVHAITPSGSVSTFATGLILPFGMLRTTDNRLLVAEATAGEVTDISAGGNFASATPFASGLTNPLDLAQTADGRIFVAEGSTGETPRSFGEISDITLGGAIGPANVLAGGTFNPYSFQSTPTGNGLIASDINAHNVLAISLTGVVTPFATGRDVFALAYTPEARLLAAAAINDRVVDLSAGGNIATAPTFANVPGAANLAVVPIPEPATLSLLTIAAIALRRRRACAAECQMPG